MTKRKPRLCADLVDKAQGRIRWAVAMLQPGLRAAFVAGVFQALKEVDDMTSGQRGDFIAALRKSYPSR